MDLLLVIYVVLSCLARRYCFETLNVPSDSVEIRLLEMEKMLKLQFAKIEMQENRMEYLEDIILKNKNEYSEHKNRIKEQEEFARKILETVEKQATEIKKLTKRLNYVAQKQVRHENNVQKLRKITNKGRFNATHWSTSQKFISSSDTARHIFQEPQNFTDECRDRRLLENSIVQPSPSTVHPVAFYAYLQQTESYPDTHHILKFDNVKTDSTGSYSKFTGTFTIPIDGIYGFLYALRLVCHINNAKSPFELVRNDVVESTVLVYNHGCTGDQITVTGNAIIQASQGDKVFVRSHSTFPLDGYIMSDANGRTSFAGWLIG